SNFNDEFMRITGEKLFGDNRNSGKMLQNFALKIDK
ncbi:uncharacterized protein METZ01_LOCUS246593, partial [marine metagenome]